MDEDQLGALIETIYTSAFEEDGWDAVLDALLAPFHAATATSVVWRTSDAFPVFTASTLFDQSLVKDYVAYYHTVEPGRTEIFENIDAFKVNNIYSRFDKVSFADYPKTEFYCDFGRKCDFGQSMFAMSDNNSHGVGNTHLYRPLHSPEFDAQEKKLLRILAPHLNRGLRIYRELGVLRTKASLFETGFDMLAATFLLDAAGRVLRLNKNAETLLDSGGPLTVHEGRLAARHPADDTRLVAALKPLQPGDAPPELILRGPEYCPGVRLGVTPVSGVNMPVFFDVTHTARAAFMVTATALGPSLQNLMASYGLTRAEAEVSLLLTQGLRAAQIATRRETSTATVNTQLKHIYAKVGVDGHVGLLVKLLGR
jgi:DNA-binding CsgD family transcriptional regulator